MPPQGFRFFTLRCSASWIVQRRGRRDLDLSEGLLAALTEDLSHISVTLRTGRAAAGPLRPGFRATRSPFEHGLAFVRDQQIVHVVGMLFFNAQDLLQHGLGAGIVVAEIADQLAIMVHRDALGDQDSP
jgi:hypothetical protein